MQRAMSVAGPLPFPTITGLWEWRIGEEGEDRRHINMYGTVQYTVPGTVLIQQNPYPGIAHYTARNTMQFKKYHININIIQQDSKSVALIRGRTGRNAGSEEAN
jgi:hypothetical protein